MILISIFIGVLALLMTWIFIFWTDVLMHRDYIYDGKGSAAIQENLDNPFICNGIFGKSYRCEFIEIFKEFLFYTLFVLANIKQVANYVAYIFFPTAGIAYFIQYRFIYGKRKNSTRPSQAK